LTTRTWSQTKSSQSNVHAGKRRCSFLLQHLLRRDCVCRSNKAIEISSLSSEVFSDHTGRYYMRLKHCQVIPSLLLGPPRLFAPCRGLLRLAGEESGEFVPTSSHEHIRWFYGQRKPVVCDRTKLTSAPVHPHQTCRTRMCRLRPWQAGRTTA